jgi:hypothetical protein
MRCVRCGGLYIAGVVGRTPWPPHECPESDPACPNCRGAGEVTHLEENDDGVMMVVREPCICAPVRA